MADSQPVAEVEIVKLSLVARKAGERKKERESDNVGGATVNGLKNFKKFSKVCKLRKNKVSAERGRERDI